MMYSQSPRWGWSCMVTCLQKHSVLVLLEGPASKVRLKCWPPRSPPLFGIFLGETVTSAQSQEKAFFTGQVSPGEHSCLLYHRDMPLLRGKEELLHDWAISSITLQNPFRTGPSLIRAALTWNTICTDDLCAVPLTKHPAAPGPQQNLPTTALWSAGLGCATPFLSWHTYCTFGASVHKDTGHFPPPLGPRNCCVYLGDI